jgi:MbtH protein
VGIHWNFPMRDDIDYRVVINEEEQYSIWPSFKESLPPGWRAVGFEGDKQSCLAQINELWIDMRPRSLRESMAETQVEGGGVQIVR